MLFMQQLLTISVMGERVPWYVKPIIGAFVGQVKVRIREGKKHWIQPS